MGFQGQDLNASTMSKVLDGSVQSMPILLGAVEGKVKLTSCEVMN